MAVKKTSMDSQEYIKFSTGKFGTHVSSEIFAGWSLTSFTWVLAIGWLLTRAVLILGKQRSELLEQLGLSDPAIPEIVIDQLGDSWVSIYWHYSPHNASRNRRPKLKKHLVSIGGRLIEVSGDRRRLFITDLIPDTAYNLTVQPVYAINSEAAKLAPSSSKSSRLQASISLHTLKSLSERIFDPNCNNGERLPTVPSYLKLSPEQLQQAQIILGVQKEISEVSSQIHDSEAQYTVKSKNLTQKISELKSIKKTDELIRSQLRAENKSLEDDDHALEVQVTKIKLHAGKVAKYKADSELNKERILEIDRLHLQKKEENDHLLDQLEARLKQVQSHEIELNDILQKAIKASRTQDVTNANVKDCIQKLRSSSQASAQEKLAFIYSEDAESLTDFQKGDLRKEILLDDRIETEWVKAQKSLEQQYVDAYLRNSEQKAQLRAQQEHFRRSQIQLNPSHHELQERAGQSTAPIGNLVNHSLENLGTKKLAGSNVIMSSSLNGNMNSSLVPPTISGLPSNGNIQQVSNSPSSLASLRTIPSVSSIQPISSSRQSLPQDPYDVFSHHSRSSSHVQYLPVSSQSDFNQYRESIISPAAADDLLPSNLFQETTSNDQKLGSTTDESIEEQHITEEVATPPRENKFHLRDSSWLPWLSPQSKQARRTSSLFFGSHGDGQASPSSLALEDAADDSEAGDTSSVSRSPLRGMGSRFFQKNSNNKSGSFRRRLSFFPRKESENKVDEEAA